MEKYSVKITFTEPLLGTVALDKELYGTYLGSKNPNGTQPDELLSIEEQMEKSTTGFFRDPADSQPMLMDYQVKGFLKDSCGMLRRTGEAGSRNIKAYLKVLDGLVFVFPRFIRLGCTRESITIFERPLRAQTAQGERIALARSEKAPAGTTLEFQVLILGQITESLLQEWLEYGALRGIGQWRNAGYGRFQYEMTAL